MLKDQDWKSIFFHTNRPKKLFSKLFQAEK